MIKFLVAIFVIVVLIILCSYNRLINLRNKVRRSKSGIDVYLTQRFDLIPKLVECVKEYCKYENETIQKIVLLKEKYNQEKELKDGEELDKKCDTLILEAESYPELKANEQFLNLQKELSKLENQLQAARRIYNIDVNEYNTAIEQFPTNAIAKVFKFKELEFFEIDKDKKK